MVSLGCAFSSACELGPSAAEKAEAGTLCRAVDTLRDAPNPAKEQLMGTLEHAPCQTPDLCALKQLCLSGYAEHLRGLAETNRAKAALGARESDPGNDAEAAHALDAAQTALKKAAPLLARCADDEAAAQRKYKP